MNTATSRTRIESSGGGKMVVLAMFGLAVIAASFAWGWNYYRGQRALAFFGPEGALLIRTAPKVEYLRAEPDANIDISKARGLLNARTSLLSDASYDWSAPHPRQDSPLFSVRFSRGDRSISVTFDFENRTIRSSSTGQTAALDKKMADGWQSFLSQQTKIAPPLTPLAPARMDPSE